MSCRHIEIDTSGTDLVYRSGDHLAVYPHNALSHVSRAAAVLGVDLDCYFRLLPKQGANGPIVTLYTCPPFPPASIIS